MILQGDCLQVLSTMDEKIIQTCVTSPPYFGLRDYGTARFVGGTDETCDHTYQKGGRNPDTSAKQISSAGTTFSQYERVCKRCGALRIDDQIGLEDTPERYVERLVAVFREVRRVLKDDGVLWLNLGDSYWGGGENRNGMSTSSFGLNKTKANQGMKRKDVRHDVIKPKDLIGIPWMVAFALRADGWYLRSDIIWAKPNPMPESVTDRPTKSHEYIFLMSKSATYFYDYEAILEPANYDGRKDIMMKGSEKYQNGFAPTDDNPNTLHTKGHERWSRTTKNLQPDGQKPNTMHKRRAEGLPDNEYPARNKRTVWTVNTKPYKHAHFATFPEKLIEPCILAGSRVGDIVLDPFAGSGTTLSVAVKHHRQAIGIELNPDYIALSEKRLTQTQPVLMGVG